MRLCPRHLSFVYVSSLLVDSTFFNSNLIWNLRTSGFSVIQVIRLLGATHGANHPYQVLISRVSPLYKSKASLYVSEFYNSLQAYCSWSKKEFNSADFRYSCSQAFFTFSQAIATSHASAGGLQISRCRQRDLQLLDETNEYVVDFILRRILTTLKWKRR